MVNEKILFVLFIVILPVLTGCADIEIYKVEYKGNIPEGTFKAIIGNETAFQNGPDILEVASKKSPEFFCYSVNKEILCKLDIPIKISENAAKGMQKTLEQFEEDVAKSGKNRTTLPQRLSYYLNNNKLLQEDVIFIKDIKNVPADNILIPILGKGKTEKAAKEDATAQSKKIINIMIDKK